MTTFNNPEPTSSAVPDDMQRPNIPDRSSSSAGKKRRDAAKNASFPLPKLRLECRDLIHPATAEFFSAVNGSKVMIQSVQAVLELLYETPTNPHTTVPPTRSVTVVLRSMPGVAYTTGTDLDNDHKEIHFSLDYIKQIAADRKTPEISGVLVHELVHCFQYNAHGTAPGGLIEGIADWVRLNAEFAPPHWKRVTDGKWDSGYERTGYFLDYLEKRFGDGTVRRLNEKLRTAWYVEKNFWTELVGRPIDQLWDDYKAAVKADEHTPRNVFALPSPATFGPGTTSTPELSKEKMN